MLRILANSGKALCTSRGLPFPTWKPAPCGESSEIDLLKGTTPSLVILSGDRVSCDCSGKTSRCLCDLVTLIFQFRYELV